MRFLDVVVLFLLFVFLVGGVYFLWLYFPRQPTLFEEYAANVSVDLPPNSSQFHPNMRYPDRKIGYYLSANCSVKKQNDFIDAIRFLERETILEFYESDKPEILISCANIPAEPDEDGHFVAGEGGPSVIVNASRFAVILVGKVALYRPETCDTPQISTHELLHALGFDHNGNSQSIMFPVTNCEQTLDENIISEINRLYLVPSEPDLVLERAGGNKTGRYFNFEVSVANFGLKLSESSRLVVLADNEEVKFFELGELNIGARKSLEISNLRIPSDTRIISLIAETSENEISKDNNRANIRVLE